MSTAHRFMDDCVRFSASIAAYVDGELDAAHAVDMEAHVIGCDTCAERVALIRAMRLSMKRTAERCPAALRARIQATLEQEKQRAATPDASDRRELEASPKLIRLRYAVGLAAAAGVAFAMGMSRYVQPRVGSDRPVTAANMPPADEFGIDRLLEELVAMHAHPFRPDTTDQDQLGTFDPLLGVRVRRPAFQPFGARFQGARVHAVSDRGAYLQLQYALPADGKHITMYVFNPRVVAVRATRLQSKVVRHRPVLVGQFRGYSVAALEESGVGYAVASDFDTDESTRMVIAALQQ